MEHQFHKLGDILSVEGMRGIDVEYKGYMEEQLSIPRGKGL